VSDAGRAAILTPVGFNPYQKHQANAGDIVLAVAALVVALALVLWAVLG